MICGEIVGVRVVSCLKLCAGIQGTSETSVTEKYELLS